MRLDGDDTERNFIAVTGGEIVRFCVAMLILSKTISKVGRSDSHTGRSDSHTCNRIRKYTKRGFTLSRF